MKAPTLQSFLEECRAAKTSEALGGVIAQIECRREALTRRSGMAWRARFKVRSSPAAIRARSIRPLLRWIRT
jgi:hypothetical protein